MHEVHGSIQPDHFQIVRAFFVGNWFSGVGIQIGCTGDERRRHLIRLEAMAKGKKGRLVLMVRDALEEHWPRSVIDRPLL